MPITPESVLLTGRRAVVTGAAQGIGAAIATTFARFGADLAICDRDADGLARTTEEIVANGRHVHTELLDVRDGDAVREWIAALDAVDVLVNNAGGGFEARFTEVNDKGQDALIRENFVSVTHCIRACVAKMPDRGGSVVNITSIEAHRAAPGYAVYSAMKAAVVNLTETLALELGDRRIRVFARHQPTIDSDLAAVLDGVGRRRSAMDVVDRKCRTAERRMPLLGVCLGHQALAAHHGGTVGRAPAPRHGKSSRISHDGTGLFQGLPSPFEAGRYHSLVVEEKTLPAALRVTARSDGGLVMAIAHRELPAWGVQFHPESVLTPEGERLIGNFLNSGASR